MISRRRRRRRRRRLVTVSSAATALSSRRRTPTDSGVTAECSSRTLNQATLTHRPPPRPYYRCPSWSSNESDALYADLTNTEQLERLLTFAGNCTSTPPLSLSLTHTHLYHPTYFLKWHIFVFREDFFTLAKAKMTHFHRNIPNLYCSSYCFSCFAVCC